uniref:Uncharacterized protein n=1 Tax=Ditylenchus dipsaci TaxID=166011 RepID=A0A915DU37_9BILA
MEQQRSPLSSMKAISIPKLIVENRSSSPSPVMVRPLLAMPRHPLFPMSGSPSWPMMVAANLNWMLAFHHRQNLFARPMFNGSQQPCSSQSPESLTQILSMTKPA